MCRCWSCTSRVVKRWTRSPPCAKGLLIFGETCPQDLFLTAADLDLDGFEGAKHICSPPPRDASSQETVWRGLMNGTFQVFSSDHAPFRYESETGKKVKGDSASFVHVPNGIPGVETTSLVTGASRAS